MILLYFTYPSVRFFWGVLYLLGDQTKARMVWVQNPSPLKIDPCNGTDGHSNLVQGFTYETYTVIVHFANC